MKFPLPWWMPAGAAPEISATELQQWLQQQRPLQIVDARSWLEYRQGTIAAARHAPLSGMPQSLARLQLEKQVPVLVLCLTGHRSLPGTRWLRRRGYAAYSLAGGVGSWLRAGYALARPKQ